MPISDFRHVSAEILVLKIPIVSFYISNIKKVKKINFLKS